MRNKERCKWVDLNNPLYIKYHDTAWGVPVHSDRLLFEKVRLSQFNPAALQNEAVKILASQAGQTRQPEATGALVLFLQRRTDNAGQIADFLGDQIIMLHEPLDTQTGFAVVIMQTFANLHLHIERQAFLRSVRQIVQTATHFPEKFFGFLEAP